MKKAWFLARMFVMSAAVVALVLWVLTWGADLVDKPSNVDVGAGGLMVVLALAGVGVYAYWLMRRVRGGLADAPRRITRLRRKPPIVAGIIALLLLGGCTKVPPGFVGVRVKMYGQQRGVQDIPIVTG